jgi:hypothetical protein
MKQFSLAVVVALLGSSCKGPAHEAELKTIDSLKNVLAQTDSVLALVNVEEVKTRHDEMHNNMQFIQINIDKMGDTLDFKTGLYLSEYKQLRKQLQLIKSGVVQNSALVDSVMKNLNDFEHDLKNNTLDKSVNLEGAIAAEKMQVNALYQGSLNLPKLFIESRTAYDTLSPKVNAFVDQLSTKMNLKK